MKYLIFAALLVSTLVGISLYQDIYSVDATVVSQVVHQASPTPIVLPTSSPRIVTTTIDEYVSYTIPTNWKKAVLDNHIEETLPIELYSPNYRYNSAEGPDDGLRVTIIRQKYDFKKTLAEAYKVNENPYVAEKDYHITSVTIDGSEGLFIPAATDGPYDPNYRNLLVLHNGYRYSFLFSGANGDGQRDAVNQFIQSIKFK